MRKGGKRKGFSAVSVLIAIALGGAVLFGDGLWGWMSPASAPAPWSATSTLSLSSSSSTSTGSTSTRRIGTPSATLSPSGGTVGTVVTVRAHGITFAASSTVELNDMAGAQVSAVAPDGSWLTFVVPADLGPVCKPHVPCPLFRTVLLNGTYAVSVVMGGIKVSAGSFTVTGHPL